MSFMDDMQRLETHPGISAAEAEQLGRDILTMAEEDPRIEQYEAERAEAIEVAHKAMISSYIGGPPKLRGDAERMVAALLKAGWTPPAETVVEHAEQYTGGAMLVRNEHPELERIFPLADWIVSQQRFGGRVFKRRVIVVDDWTEVPRG